jgi:tetratricopeptide (TPR) repeat protein
MLYYRNRFARTEAKYVEPFFARTEAKYVESFSKISKKGDEAAQNGNTRKAIEYYSLALELKPNDTATLVKLGHAFCHQNDQEQGINYYLQALAIDVHDVWAAYWLGRIRYYG